MELHKTRVYHVLRRRFCQRVSVDCLEQFGRWNFIKRVFVTCVELHSSSALGPRQDFRCLLLRLDLADCREQPHGPAQWCDETHNSLLKSCMATFQPLGTLGSCLDFRKFPKLAAPRGAALHVMYCTCVNMCNGWLFVPVHVCVPAPPGVFLPDHESTGTCRPRGAVDSGPAALESAAASVVALTCGLCVVGGFGWL